MITSHFDLNEFESHDGAPMPDDVFLNIVQVAVSLEVLRTALGGLPIKINSGYRSPQHNANVGGVPNSTHTKGLASDIAINGITPEVVYQKIIELRDLGLLPQGGTGLYDSFVHFDIRGTNASWDYRKKKDETTESAGKPWYKEPIILVGGAFGVGLLLYLFA